MDAKLKANRIWNALKVIKFTEEMGHQLDREDTIDNCMWHINEVVSEIKDFEIEPETLENALKYYDDVKKEILNIK